MMSPMQPANAPRSRKVIILVPGESEYDVIPYILLQFGMRVAQPVKTENISFSPIKSEVIISPKVFRQLDAAMRSSPDKIVLLFDTENASLCPGNYADRVRQRAMSCVPGLTYDNFAVVCANHCIENWILADHGIFKCRLFKNNLSNRIADRSDCKKAQAIIGEGFGTGRQYVKTTHLPQLAKHVNFNDNDVRRRSPSLDKFLRVLNL